VEGESYFGVLDLTYLSWTGNATSAMDGSSVQYHVSDFGIPEYKFLSHSP